MFIIYKCNVYVCVYIYIHVQPNMVNLLAKTFRYFSDEYLTKLEVGAWRQWMDIAATSVSRLGVFFLTPGPFDLTPRVYQCLSLLEQSQNIVKKRFINVYHLSMFDLLRNILTKPQFNLWMFTVAIFGQSRVEVPN